MLQYIYIYTRQDSPNEASVLITNTFKVSLTVLILKQTQVKVGTTTKSTVTRLYIAGVLLHLFSLSAKIQVIRGDIAIKI